MYTAVGSGLPNQIQRDSYVFSGFTPWTLAPPFCSFTRIEVLWNYLKQNTLKPFQRLDSGFIMQHLCLQQSYI
jgi:hypothetical protein